MSGCRAAVVETDFGTVAQTLPPVFAEPSRWRSSSRSACSFSDGSFARTRAAWSTEANSVEHTWAVIGEIESTLSTLTDAETGQRGYLLTGISSFLEPYQAAVGTIAAHLARLRELTGDNPAQQTRLHEIEDLARAKLEKWRQRSSSTTPATRPRRMRTVEAGFGNEAMKRIRETASDMRDEERRLLAERSLGARRAARRLTAAALDRRRRVARAPGGTLRRSAPGPARPRARRGRGPPDPGATEHDRCAASATPSSRPTAGAWSRS